MTIPVPEYLQRVGPQDLPRRNALKGSSIALIVSGVLFAILAIVAVYLVARDYTDGPSASSRRASTECQDNLNRIVSALQSYEAEHGHYPPAYTVDPNTQLPLHSWRVLILPYLGEEDLFRQIDLTEPWNSAKNRPLNTQMPDVYHCPGHSRTSGAFTHYLAIEGPGFLFDGTKTVKASDILDDTRFTIAVIEIANSDINWMSPINELHDSNAQYDIGNDLTSISSLHGEGAVNVGFLDGQSRQLTTRDVTASQFRTMMTIAGSD